MNVPTGWGKPGRSQSYYTFGELKGKGELPRGLSKKILAPKRQRQKGLRRDYPPGKGSAKRKEERDLFPGEKKNPESKKSSGDSARESKDFWKSACGPRGSGAALILERRGGWPMFPGRGEEEGVTAGVHVPRIVRAQESRKARSWVHPRKKQGGFGRRGGEKKRIYRRLYGNGERRGSQGTKLTEKKNSRGNNKENDVG